MPNYQQGKIYKLEGGGKYYIGSTTNRLSKRRGDHCADAKEECRQKTKAYSHFNSIGWDNVLITLLEDYPCLSKQELLQRENDYILLNINDCNLLNCKRSIITDNDRKIQKAEWYKSERGQQVAKECQENNKKEIQCECGMLITKGCIAKHRKRNVHLRHLEMLGK